MYTTREQRKSYLTSWKKQNPNASAEEIKKVKKMLAELGKQKHQALRNEILQNSTNIDKSEVLNEEVPTLPEDDFQPDDL